MIALQVEAPYANFRKSFARSYAETYTYPPPSTVYGMLLSLVGERKRRSHLGVRLAMGFARKPRIATVLKKLSRYKYGVAGKQSALGNAPDYMEVVCGVNFVVCVDSSGEDRATTLESRVGNALDRPESIERTGVLCLGLSDDLVDVIRRPPPDGDPSIDWLVEDSTGPLELPVWVDHVGASETRWRRYRQRAGMADSPPDEAWISILPPEKL